MKILLEGPILTQSGYGEHTRLVYKALKLEKENDIYVNPLRWGNTSWILKETKLNQNIEKDIRALGDLHQEALANGTPTMEFDLHVHVGIISEFTPKAPRTVCVTAGIETDKVSKEWLLKTYKEGPQKIIVPSVHAATSFLKTTHEIHIKDKKVELRYNDACKMAVVPYPIKNITSKDLDLKIETKFNFLSIALAGHRKNLEDLICWFSEEFKNDDVGLILKTANANGSIIDRQSTINRLTGLIKKYNNRKCKIYLLHGDLSEEEMHSLYKREDIHAYVTTTRGEGFGLPIFEAAYSGLPIIATDWSGHLDFLQAPVKEGKKIKTKKLFARINYKLEKVSPKAVWETVLIAESRWAQVQEASFKRQVRNVMNSYGRYKKWALTLQKHLSETHREINILERLKKEILGIETFPGSEKLKNRIEEDIEISGTL